MKTLTRWIIVAVLALSDRDCGARSESRRPVARHAGGWARAAARRRPHGQRSRGRVFRDVLQHRPESCRYYRHHDRPGRRGQDRCGGGRDHVRRQSEPRWQLHRRYLCAGPGQDAVHSGARREGHGVCDPVAAAGDGRGRADHVRRGDHQAEQARYAGQTVYGTRSRSPDDQHLARGFDHSGLRGAHAPGCRRTVVDGVRQVRHHRTSAGGGRAEHRSVARHDSFAPGGSVQARHPPREAGPSGVRSHGREERSEADQERDEPERSARACCSRGSACCRP